MQLAINSSSIYTCMQGIHLTKHPAEQPTKYAILQCILYKISDIDIHIQSIVKIRELMSVVIQFTPSNKLSPVTALQPCISQWWVLIVPKFNAYKEKISLLK